ncbi:hypothetical protein [Pseudovibrio ascidiaceicola]|uniref:hypothetical protein n=1 Tax=Pseudovibrio ascidiaceicola TaxID=285279 RepID=UPI000D69EC9C|nr:hypothetical protein [Pseudovibrio ascidiaceicola]
MSLTRSAKVALAATAIVAIVGVQTASANRAVLVSQDLCNDDIPLTPTVLSWLTNPDYGQNYSSIYVFSGDGEIFPITKDAPDFETVTDLFVLGHGNCSRILNQSALDFAGHMYNAFDGNEPENITLGSCKSGVVGPGSPASELALAFPNTSIKAFSTNVSIMGNGSQFPEDWTFGSTAQWQTPAVTARMDLLLRNIHAKWLADEVGATQKSCTSFLIDAVFNRTKNSFDGFADMTLQEFSNADAKMGNYNIAEFYSYKTIPGLTACRRGLPFSSDAEPCANAQYTPPPQ